ncbi:hypothetical protein EI42_00726 [Thermosporothrix hazakensis]|jgi:hypothetical protein|uniref:Uncharacterized protein n=2 Tax=Thermosporothrix TaxID=768650 RepID=A0A326UIB3_THEHA|nr:hypothetical protein [Thermosporothrix hazakensis]PZW36550.1 hypothetical protein EI42_00726 [Thermosporothrix hazakensis]BBH89016.1 hypothetical protein KTC_37670 [Thermosporothrix sp. COM3]GCE47200.1 hypothetical protein KTH_20690 [Thermosporothrix hazakensis]
MNVSTGGPHILLFERDQQLAGLLTSELQLAGYECHTARTAVEVFDTIAHQPIRLILVNISQAAAARREFWVALDTQRRGRGIQVLTFNCTNIAGYGAREFEDGGQSSTADLEVDGMIGIMSLVDAVRSRVPNQTVSAPSGNSTLPRVPRVPPPPPMSPTTPSSPRSVMSGAYTTSTNQAGGNTAQRFPSSPDYNPYAPPRSNQPFPGNTAASGNDIEHTVQTTSYTDKIRAVLYPNQRNWTTQQGNEPETEPVDNNKPAYEYQTPSKANESTILQRLASGQEPSDPANESGLAQLSRLVQSRQPIPNEPPVAPEPSTVTYNTNTPFNQPVPPAFTQPEPQPQTPEEFVPSGFHAVQQQQSQLDPYNPQPIEEPQPDTFVQSGIHTTLTGMRMLQSSAEGVRTIKPNEDSIASQPLRAAPIQDIPVERPGSQNQRRTEPQTQPAPATNTPLASIASATVASSTPPRTTAQSLKVETTVREEEDNEQEEQIFPISKNEPNTETKGNSNQALVEQIKAEIKKVANEPLNESETSKGPNNAVLMNIMQSLPPMPAPTAQAPQPQVLNGHATRTLNSVLLEGHLVPESRLQVAQNIQRMLRGVDLNYQLGEILLMFKLLTPDQLLAASLLSHGLITTAQIAALGRIRQELHSIGLEYDLENLLILFRILTPEQIREVKSEWQG